MAFNIFPNLTLMDENVNVRIEDLPKNAEVTLYSNVDLSPHNAFYSLTHYVTNQDGSVDLTRDNSFGGFYVGCEPMGFLWSMQRHPRNKKKFTRFTVDKVEEPLQIRMEVYRGFKHFPDEMEQDVPMATGIIKRSYMANGVTRIPVNTHLKGTLFIPSGKGPFPATIAVRGATPLLIETRAALLASRGIMTFVIVFYGRKDLPENFNVVNMDYIQHAIDFLRFQPTANSDLGVGILGASLGGSIALVAGAKLKGVRSVVSLSGPIYSDVGTFQSNNFTIPQRPNVNVAKYTPKDEMKVNLKLRSPFEDNEQPYVIPFHKSKNVNYLMLYGENDLVCPSITFASHAKQLFDAVGHTKYKIFLYHGTGHLINTPNDPLFPSGFGSWNKSIVQYGGKEKENNEAQIKAWKEILNFMKTTLSPNCFKK